MTAYVAALLAFLLPGAGHFYLGRRSRAAIFFGVIAVALVVGCLLEGELSVPVGGRPLVTLRAFASMGSGIVYFLLQSGFGYEGNVEAKGFDYGGAFLLTAGLMNILLVLDVWDIARGSKE